MSTKSQVWEKALLAGGLLLVLVFGLFQIPEVRAWHSPESLWKIKIQQLQMECGIIEKRLESANDLLKTLGDIQGKSPAKRSWDDRLRLVQKNCLSSESRLKYVDAKLAALKVAMENRIPGAAPALTSELNRFLEQIKNMELQSAQYHLDLESVQKKLRTIKLALAAQK